MIVADFEPVSLNDFPGRIATVVFIHGCNLLCRFCYNRELVLKNFAYVDKTKEFFKFLKENGIKSVAITGGEPLFHPNIFEFLYELKGDGIETKLDTNGFSSKKLKIALDEKLLDYVAVDVKGFSDEEIKYITRCNLKFRYFADTYRLLKKYGVPFELRITVWRDFQKETLKNFFMLIDSNDKVVLQKPIVDKPLLDKRFESQLKRIDFERNVEVFMSYFPKTKVRNIL
ncbi:radical SAM protein [Deferribacter autotrophicus]|uniref:Radical SAM protein n=1 Tax=Deferribacter autotrophicus TaxID=500465 RepID=A0A5A8F1Q6_9BACT|nr:radical SAM protein [Deferribacter autotrophicus]KAA0257840.1 radical SAM protein [Deferribacter autotrophicus]